jgi:DNA-binding protein YbaB
MDGTILDPDGARERLAAWKGRIDKMAAETQAMGARLQELRVTASDRNGLAEVTVDSTGTLVGLQLTERIGRVTPEGVAQAIMTAFGEARNRLADRSQEVVAETVGTESPAARAIADSIDRHLRRDLPADAGRGGDGGNGSDDGSDDDEDFDIRSNLRR